jgi:tetratricopeptide (TPR) repeat protein
MRAESFSTTGLTLSAPSETIDSENPESGDSLGVRSLDGVDEPLDPITGMQVALVGRFGGMNHREATNLLRSRGANVVSVDAKDFDWVVIGADEPPLAESELLDPTVLTAAARGKLEILHETDLWQRLGLVDVEQSIRRFHTPAMLAHLLGVSVRVIRRWHRLGLITPIRTVHKLPYFDYQEVATARRLAEWIASGASDKAIERRLVELVAVLPDIGRPLDQLSILVEGKQVLLRQDGGLLEAGGQLRFDFDALEGDPGDSAAGNPRSGSVLSFAAAAEESAPFRESAGECDDELLTAACDAEDNDDLETAVDYYHAILARDGARADICFQLGELLYRLGHLVAARERYYAAIELEPDYVEARASLAGVLAEVGQLELAIAAFRGALSLHEEYADVHFNLARALEEVGRNREAKHHWKRFLEISPHSPWANEAASCLAEGDDPG